MKQLTSPFVARPLRLFVLLMLAGSFMACSGTRKVIRKIDHTFESAEAFHQGFAGFILYDPEEKEVLYSHNSDKYFTPASNTKLFTFYTGLKILGDSVPALKYEVRNDSLIFRGTGDPSFLHKEFSYSKVFDFLKNREEDLYYAPPNYREKHFGPGWAWGDYNWYYSAERGAFPIHGNSVSIRFSPSDTVPKASPSFFSNLLQPETDLSGTVSRATRELTENLFRYRHRPGNKAKEQEVPFIYSHELMVEILSDTLQREVVLLDEKEYFGRAEKTLYSIPSDSLYKRMLQVSDNFIAEQILLMSAGEIADTLKSDIAIDYMKENHLNDLPDEPQWVDGSGLSRYNLFTPRSIVRLLEKINGEIAQEKLLKLLPAGGESGTLKNFYKAEEPYIFAKTGTLNNNHSLSGFIKTRSGRVLMFSFMNSNYTIPTSLLKEEMENILRNVHLNF